MNQRELVVNFRTPQHPSMGTNNWGGASPLLARNLPKEALDISYLRLNTIRTRDGIFPANHEFNDLPILHPAAPTYVPPPTPTPSRRSSRLFSKMTWSRNKEKVLGSTEKKRWNWLPRLNPHNRWPQGW
ncbi:hypothetical protein FRX31_003083 [Thalictrum thalictroides]|uniref:Uncharacterized protein n=1 Tax=Thalictrum thalictroides TaxID=46969 RepID=A0A7J6XE83_THATH|nr:hypothetical protein FRX31_003083 [Thalictrum thalictroides]